MFEEATVTGDSEESVKKVSVAPTWTSVTKRIAETHTNFLTNGAIKRI